MKKLLLIINPTSGRKKAEKHIDEIVSIFEQAQYQVQLNLPGLVDLTRRPDAAYVELGDPGVPHAVAEYAGDLWGDKESLREQMRALRYDPAFPKGANVNFYQVLGEDEVRLLTFERGVEDFTLACGTGTGSTAAVMWRKGLLSGNALTAHNPGGTLKITVGGEGETVNTILLEGPTEITKIYDL